MKCIDGRARTDAAPNKEAVLKRYAELSSKGSCALAFLSPREGLPVTEFPGWCEFR
ncbi:MAG: hypothetical protein JSR19_04145 [Proteobacteria bacterium]|nr:hypothetical protein [Pseudomonadota bacterium]HQR04283.1 hypothetical protein [Rhodocyclaceae bacterium]